DLSRWAEAYGVPFRMSSRFPVNAIRPMRLLLCRDGEARAEMARALFTALWVDDGDITSDEELVRAAQASGLQPAQALETIQTQPIKDQLRASTDEAIARGAFGAPAFVVGSDLFWGNDRLHFLEQALQKPELG